MNQTANWCEMHCMARLVSSFSHNYYATKLFSCFIFRAVCSVTENFGELEQLQTVLSPKNGLAYSSKALTLRVLMQTLVWDLFQKLLFQPLLKYMIPLTTVYFAEYLINQGIVELIIFDCSHGFRLAQASQYRWYQVTY